ncbi:MAG: sulfotransferase [Actinomycetia bacterium]|nr:sulfotransferase [Actinomycetes bacterium]
MGDFLTDAQRLVFVGGLHRSGTTLLARLLASHPDATGLAGTGVPEDEGQHVQAVYPPAERFGGSGRFALNSQAHLTETSPLATSESAQQLWDAWQPYWDSERRFLIEKSPLNLIMGRFLQNLFPTASFVFIVRHPVTVTLATRKWRRRTSLPKLMENWFSGHDVARDDLAHLTRVHVVSYEWLLADPKSTMAEVTEFLSMPGEVDVGSVDGSSSDVYETQWPELLHASHRGAVKAHRLYQDRAKAFGYDLNDLRLAPRHPLVDATGMPLT